jgi:hypothetical protein
MSRKVLFLSTPKEGSHEFHPTPSSRQPRFGGHILKEGNLRAHRIKSISLTQWGQGTPSPVPEAWLGQ